MLTKGGEIVTEFEKFISCIVNETKERPEEPAKPERMGNHDKEHKRYPEE